MSLKKLLIIPLAVAAFSSASAQQTDTAEFNPRSITGPKATEASAQQVGEWSRIIRNRLNYKIEDYIDHQKQYVQVLNDYQAWLIKNTSPEIEKALPADSSKASLLERQSFELRKSALETVNNFLKGANDRAHHDIKVKQCLKARQNASIKNNGQ